MFCDTHGHWFFFLWVSQSSLYWILPAQNVCSKPLQHNIDNILPKPSYHGIELKPNLIKWCYFALIWDWCNMIMALIILTFQKMNYFMYTCKSNFYVQSINLNVIKFIKFFKLLEVRCHFATDHPHPPLPSYNIYWTSVSFVFICFFLLL